MTESFVLVKVTGDPAALDLIPGPGCDVVCRWTRPDEEAVGNLADDLNAGLAIPPDRPDWEEDEDDDKDGTDLADEEATARPVVVVPAPPAVRTLDRPCPQCGGALLTNEVREWCIHRRSDPLLVVPCDYGSDWPVPVGGNAPAPARED